MEFIAVEGGEKVVERDLFGTRLPQWLTKGNVPLLMSEGTPGLNTYKPRGLTTPHPSVGWNELGFLDIPTVKQEDIAQGLTCLGWLIGYVIATEVKLGLRLSPTVLKVSFPQRKSFSFPFPFLFCIC